MFIGFLGARNLNARAHCKGKSIAVYDKVNEDKLKDRDEEEEDEVTLLMLDDDELSFIDIGDDNERWIICLNFSIFMFFEVFTLTFFFIIKCLH